MGEEDRTKNSSRNVKCFCNLFYILAPVKKFKEDIEDILIEKSI